MFWKVIDIKDTSKNSCLEKKQAYKWKPFAKPIYPKPDVNGSFEEQIIAAEEKSDPINFRVESRAQFVDGVNAYFIPEMVREIFLPWNGKVLHEQATGRNDTEYHMHCDPAVVNDMFGAMIAHSVTQDKPDEFGRVLQHTVVDWYTVWRPEDFPDHRIDYRQVIGEMEQKMIAFRPSTASCDQFNSAYIVDSLRDFARRNRINCSVFEQTATSSSNNDMYEALKFSINNGLVHSYQDSLNENENWRCLLQAMLEKVQLSKGKIVKPRENGFGHLDLVDCLAILNMRIAGNQRGNTYDNLTMSSYIDNNSIISQRIASAKLSDYMSGMKSSKTW